jgi:hypothetical protein
VGAFLLAPQAEADLDAVWIHLARESGNSDIATRFVDGIAERFCCWQDFRMPGEVAPTCVTISAASARTNMSSSIASLTMKQF